MKEDMDMHMKKRILPLLLSLLILLCGCEKAAPANTETIELNPLTGEATLVPLTEEVPAEISTAIDWQEIQPSESIPKEPAFEEYDIHLMALGDNLMHMGVVYSGKQDDGSLNYSFLFDGVSDFLEKADIKIINQETPLAGNQRGFSGYPNFNSPTEVGDAIADAGFNVVLQASNHSVDQGIDGIDDCVSFWSSHPDILMTGLHEPADSPGIPILTIKDKTFAILNYTYGPNYGSAPDSLTSRMNILCAVNEQTKAIDYTSLNPQVIEDIKEAEKAADMVIVCPHWGTEYETTPSSYQKNFALQMTEAGADIIIGTHPHVVQPVEQIQAENGNTALCYYSLGNYVSTQKQGKSMLEAMAWITFHVTENGISLVMEDTGVIPLVCHYTSGPVRVKNVYLLEQYSEELAADHGIISYGGISFHMSDLTTLSEEVLGSYVISAEQALSN